MKRTKYFQAAMLALLVIINLTFVLLHYRVEFQEILLCHLSLGLLFIACRNALDLIRSNGLQEHLDEQI